VTIVLEECFAWTMVAPLIWYHVPFTPKTHDARIQYHWDSLNAPRIFSCVWLVLVNRQKLMYPTKKTGMEQIWRARIRNSHS
jgi:hypothetical protein